MGTIATLVVRMSSGTRSTHIQERSRGLERSKSGSKGMEMLTYRWKTWTSRDFRSSCGQASTSCVFPHYQLLLALCKALSFTAICCHSLKTWWPRQPKIITNFKFYSKNLARAPLSLCPVPTASGKGDLARIPTRARSRCRDSVPIKWSRDSLRGTR